MTPQGRVRLAGEGTGEGVEGRLLDVSAGGVRVGAGRSLPARGTRVRVEIRLADEDRPSADPRVVLDGRGAVIWSGAGPDPQEPRQVGVRFDEPLTVRRPFPEVSLF